MSKEKKLAQVLHYDLQGKREFKYDFLNENSLASIAWNKLEPNEPNYFLVKKDFIANSEYHLFFKLSDLFNSYSAGIQTKRDGLFIDNDKILLQNRISKLLTQELDSAFINEFNIFDSSSFKLTEKIKKVKYNDSLISKIHYRPFDNKFIYFDSNLIGRAFVNVMQNLKHSNNLGLVISKQFNDSFKYVLVSNLICDMNLISNAGSFGAGFSFPLYLYPRTTTQQTISQSNERNPNLNTEIVKQIAKQLGLTFTIEKVATKDTFAPIDILDYIYAVLHSPTYRKKYKEFLKIDFPRIPYPNDAETFWQLVALGAEIRQIHLLESPIVEKYITQYPIDGDNVVSKISFALQDYDSLPKEREEQYYTAVYINDTQFFGNVPLEAWEFYIGGYQPAQKWLKDRKGRTLEFDDILHYQKIIVALTETANIMKKINNIDIEAKKPSR